MNRKKVKPLVADFEPIECAYRRCRKLFTPTHGGQKYCVPEHSDPENNLRKRDFLRQARAIMREAAKAGAGA